MPGRVDRGRERSRLGKEAPMWLSRLVCSGMVIEIDKASELGIRLGLSV